MNGLSVKAASRLSGVGEHTLRAWERRYQAVLPKRTESGRRVYSMDDVDRLRALARLVDQGHAIGYIARMPLATLNRILAEGGGSKKWPVEEAPSGATTGHAEPGREILPSLLKALRKFSLAELGRELFQARGCSSARAFVMDIVGPLLREVGEEVARERMSIAQEHLISALLRYHLGQLLLQTESWSEEGRYRFVLSTPEGDLHEFGILISAILCGVRRFSATYLGPNLPAKELARAAQAVHANRVILGTSPAIGGTRAYLSELDSLLPSRTEIWVGGAQAIEEISSLRSGRKVRLFQSIQELDQALSELAS